MAAIFANSTQEQTEAIQAWVVAQIHQCMTLVGRAVDFIHIFDQEQKKVTDNVDVQANRINDIITDVNRTKDQFRKSSTSIEEKTIENNQKLATIPALTKDVTTLCEETQKFAFKSEKELAELHKQTSEFAQNITVDLDAAKVGTVSDGKLDEALRPSLSRDPR